MDLSKLKQGERVAGVGGIVLLISLWLSWYGIHGVSGQVASAASSLGIDTTANAWQAFDFIDIILFVTAIAAIGAALVRASGSSESMPVAASSVVAVLGALSTVLVLYRIIDKPADGLDLKFGIFVGLLSAAAVAYGGWRGMQEEGTSLGGEFKQATGG